MSRGFENAIIFQGKSVILDAVKPLIQVRNNFLCTYHPDHLAGSGNVRAKLATAGRGSQDVPIFSQGSHAAGHKIRAGAQAADLFPLGLAVECAQLRAHGYEASGLFEFSGDAQLVQGRRMALVHLGAIGDELEEQPPGLFAILGNQGMKAVGFEGASRTLDLLLRSWL